MIAETKNNQLITLQPLQRNDYENLLRYLNGLSNETKSRFGPHAFTQEAIEAIYNSVENFTGYTAKQRCTEQIIAYAIVKKGILPHDFERLQRYGLQLDNKTDCTFAPSVADKWQSCGVGNYLLSFIIEDLKKAGFQRILLWGGVQSTNDKALQYYIKNEFTVLGRFEHNGLNLDMARSIT